jgi:hypothetical protein
MNTVRESIEVINGARIFAAARAGLAVACEGLAIAQVGPCAHCSVPELDAYTISAGLTVFGGAAALLIERYRRRKR